MPPGNSRGYTPNYKSVVHRETAASLAKHVFPFTAKKPEGTSHLVFIIVGYMLVRAITHSQSYPNCLRLRRLMPPCFLPVLLQVIAYSKIREKLKKLSCNEEAQHFMKDKTEVEELSCGEEAQHLMNREGDEFPADRSLPLLEVEIAPWSIHKRSWNSSSEYHQTAVRRAFGILRNKESCFCSIFFRHYIFRATFSLSHRLPCRNMHCRVVHRAHLIIDFVHG